MHRWSAGVQKGGLVGVWLTLGIQLETPEQKMREKEETGGKGKRTLRSQPGLQCPTWLWVPSLMP